MIDVDDAITKRIKKLEKQVEELSQLINANRWTWRTGTEADDYTIAAVSLTADGTWKTKGVSAIVSAGSTEIKIKVSITDNAINSVFQFRKDATTTRVVGSIATQVANQVKGSTFDVPLDASLQFQYFLTNTTDAATIQIVAYK